ncbi:hypothetical protein [uncultured Flavobacterium sp.]|uniref:hypothetical protein n=1 Tax=uncultured Flavobacterium sp. TaxID=165435 RepID=UPI0030EE749F|tara:strand:- start:10470 stop:11153 length:684 start_codon:yes stop_codon:yes gene_type:complete
MKFIYDFTDKFNPFLLMALNKEFLNSYLFDLDEVNEWRVNDDFEPLENLIGKEELDKSTNVLCRMYTYSDKVYEIKEVLEHYSNLSDNEHTKIAAKIQDFQYCMHKIILWLNSDSASTYNQQPAFDVLEIGFNRNNLNKKTHELFTYLVENYEKKGNIKYINIFKFLKNSDKRMYAFNFTEDLYREHIFRLKGVQITKFSTAAFAYGDKELPILNAFEEAFRKEHLK